MYILVLSDDIDMEKLVLPTKEKMMILGGKTQTLPFSFLVSLSGMHTEKYTNVEFQMLNKMSSANVAFLLGSLAPKVKSSEKIKVICDEKMQYSLADCQTDKIIFVPMEETVKTKVIKRKTKTEEGIEKTVKEDKEVKTTRRFKPETIMKKADIDEKFFAIVLAAVEKSSDANIGLPICLQTELIANEMDPAIGKELVEKIQRIYDKIKK